VADPLADRFPTLFYDIQMVEQKIPKPTPSLVEVIAAVLQNYGISNPNAAANDAVTAMQQYTERTVIG
jgi:hypothetical protein